MTVIKKCDTCGKEMEFSEWAVWHHKKQRNFDTNECFLKWVKLYFNIKDSSEDLAKIGMFILELQKNKNEVKRDD